MNLHWKWKRSSLSLTRSAYFLALPCSTREISLPRKERERRRDINSWTFRNEFKRTDPDRFHGRIFVMRVHRRKKEKREEEEEEGISGVRVGGARSRRGENVRVVL